MIQNDEKDDIVKNENACIETSPGEILTPDMRTDIPAASPSSRSITSTSPPAYSTATAQGHTVDVPVPISDQPFVQSVLAPSQETHTYKDTLPPDSETIQAINTIELRPGQSSQVNNQRVIYDTQTSEEDNTTDEHRPNGITKKISQALTEKILKKRNSNNMVHGTNSCSMVVSSAGGMNGYIHHDNSMQMNSKHGQYAAVKSETLLGDFDHEINGCDIATQMDNSNSMNISPLRTTLELPVSLPLTTASDLCGDTVQQQPISMTMSSVHEQQGQIPYQSLQLVQNVHTTFQSNITPQTSVQTIQSSTPVRQNSYTPTNSAMNYYGNGSGYYPMGTSPDRDIILERYIQQQQYFQEVPYQYGIKEQNNYAMKSPDSGFHEPCLSPTENKPMVSFIHLCNIHSRYVSIFQFTISSLMKWVFYVNANNVCKFSNISWVPK